MIEIRTRTISILPRAADIDFRAGVWKGKTCNPVPPLILIILNRSK